MPYIYGVKYFTPSCNKNKRPSTFFEKESAIKYSRDLVYRHNKLNKNKLIISSLENFDENFENRKEFIFAKTYDNSNSFVLIIPYEIA